MCFGKFDGENVTLAAAVSGNRILLHSPHVQDKNTPQTTFLRVKQKVVALLAGTNNMDPGHPLCFEHQVLHQKQGSISLTDRKFYPETRQDNVWVCGYLEVEL